MHSSSQNFATLQSATILAFCACAFATPQASIAGNESLKIEKYDSNNQSYLDGVTFYRKRLESNKTAENYAEFAEFLANKCMITEADILLKQARDNKFANHEKIIAVEGFVAYLHAKQTKVFDRYLLYLQASSTLCRRALKINPKNRLALSTLDKCSERDRHLAEAKKFEAEGDLVNASEKYESLLQEHKDDVEAIDGLLKIENKPAEEEPTSRKKFSLPATKRTKRRLEHQSTRHHTR